MINYANLDRLYDLLGELIFYGFHNAFSNGYIEESLSNSFIFKDYLNRGDDSFIDNYLDIDIYKKTYDAIDINESELNKTNTMCLCLGEAIFRLYFRYHKSLSFIFLYLSLDKLTQMFNIYHEMDWSEIYQYFENVSNSKSVLSLLLKKRFLSAKELSILTDINYQTIKNYTRGNKNIYKASFSSIYKIAQILNVDMLIFAEEINNYLDASYFDTKIKIMEYLTNYSYRVASSLDKSINVKNVSYQNKLEMLKMDNNYLKVLVPSDEISLNEKINKYKKNSLVDPSKTYLLIYLDKAIPVIDIDDNCFKKIYVLTPDSLYIVEDKHIKKEVITSTIHDAALKLSQEQSII